MLGVNPYIPWHSNTKPETKNDRAHTGFTVGCSPCTSTSDFPYNKNYRDIKQMYMKENMSLQYLFRTVKESGWIQALLVGV